MGLQLVAYEYNVRGWLTDINDPNNLGNSLFGFNIKYNDIADASKQLFNGNISQTNWKTQSPVIPGGNDVSTSYTYTYDALNRIKTGLDDTGHYNLNSITYDKNGNIKTLERMGLTNSTTTPFDVMDDLSYQYTGNQLQSVTDFAGITGFKDSQGTTDYSYDSNGNMTQDLNKGIKGATTSEDGIEYNHLNLPVIVRVNSNTDNGTISYIYDATGVKLQKNVLKNSVNTPTDYAGNYIYENDKLQFFSTPEGYVEPKDPNNLSSGYDYIYQYKDQLGNIRLSYKDISTSSTPQLEIQEENNYYPFGLKHKGYNGNQSADRNHKYGFGGKEEQDELGLGWIDITARNYDPALGRWMNLDPLAVKYASLSPYNYVANSPLIFFDPDGKEIYTIFYDEDGNKLDHIPDQVQKLFNEEYGIKVAYDSENGVLSYDGDVDTENEVSTDARNAWIKELKKGDASEGNLVFGYNLSYDEKSTIPGVGTFTSEQPIAYGVASGNTAYFDLGDFDGQNAKGEWVSENGYDLRSFNLGRLSEHEFLGHVIKGLTDADGGENTTGDTVDLVNEYRNDINVQQRSDYSTGFIHFNRGSGNPSAILPSESILSKKNKIKVN